MGVKERRERDREATRTSILSAARALSDQNGWSSVTIRSVAAAAEYSPALIYEYFASKEAILVELMRVGFSELHIDLTAANRKKTPAAEAVEAIGLAYWSFATRNPSSYQIMHGLGGVPFGTEETPREARACFDDLRAPVEALLTDRGGAPDQEVADQVNLYWSFLHGLVSLSMNNRIKGGLTSGSQLVHRLVREFVRGCVPDGAASEEAAREGEEDGSKRHSARVDQPR